MSRAMPTMLAQKQPEIDAANRSGSQSLADEAGGEVVIYEFALTRTG